MESDIHPSLFFSYYLRPLPIHTNPPLPTLTYPYQSLPTLMSSLSPLLTPPTPHSSLPACLLDLTSLIKLHSLPLASIMFCDTYTLWILQAFEKAEDFGTFHLLDGYYISISTAALIPFRGLMPLTLYPVCISALLLAFLLYARLTLLYCSLVLWIFQIALQLFLFKRYHH